MTFFGTANAPLVPSDSLLEPLAGNCLSTVCLFQHYNCVFFHIETKSAVLFSKNHFVGSNANHFDSSHNNMRLTNGDTSIVGRSARNSITRVADTAVQRDSMRMQSIVNRLMKAESLQAMTQVLVSTVKTTGRKDGGDAHKNGKMTLDAFIRYAKKGSGLFGKRTESITNEFLRAYDAQTVNSGNTSKHNLKAYGTLETRDEMLKRLVENGGKFFAMATGKAE